MLVLLHVPKKKAHAASIEEDVDICRRRLTACIDCSSTRFGLARQRTPVSGFGLANRACLINSSHGSWSCC